MLNIYNREHIREQNRHGNNVQSGSVANNTHNSIPCTGPMIHFFASIWDDLASIGLTSGMMSLLSGVISLW